MWESAFCDLRDWSAPPSSQTDNLWWTNASDVAGYHFPSAADGWRPHRPADESQADVAHAICFTSLAPPTLLYKSNSLRKLLYQILKWSFYFILSVHFFIYYFCICFDGVVIGAQCTAIFSDLLCFPEFGY